MKHFERYKKTVYEIIGAAMDVYNELGFGLRESVYQEALALELVTRDLSCEREKQVNIFYKQQQLQQLYKLDLLIDNEIIIETKSVSELNADHRSQLFNYMRLTQKDIGILINFGNAEQLQGERYVRDSDNICYRVDKNMQPLQI